MAETPSLPDLPAIQATRELLRPYVRETPVWAWRDDLVTRHLGAGTAPILKLELFQHAGSFKTRGALHVMLGLDAAARSHGVTAVSAGNHAAAVSWAAGQLGIHANVVMPRSANPARVSLSRSLGATVTLTDDVHAAFAEVQRLETEEGRTFVHPFEGPRTALGTASLGAEWVAQCGSLDAVIIPIGGGGLAGGAAAAIKQLVPRCAVFGVEPTGNDVMTRSLAAGCPQQAVGGHTIADSLAPPYTLPYSFGLCRQYVDEVVLVEDDLLCGAMYLLFQQAKLAVEPAGAAATAALFGPLRDRLAGKRIGVLVCGTNIDADGYATYLRRGRPVAETLGWTF